MAIVTMTSVAAQNSFWVLLDTAQRQPVAVTRRGRVSVHVMSPEVLQDRIDAELAMQAENEGFASPREVDEFISSLKYV